MKKKFIIILIAALLNQVCIMNSLAESVYATILTSPARSYTFGGNRDDILRDVILLEDGTFILVGDTHSQMGTGIIDKRSNDTDPQFSDGIVIRVDREGNILSQYIVEFKSKRPMTSIHGVAYVNDTYILCCSESGSTWFIETIDERGLRNRVMLDGFGGRSYVASEKGLIVTGVKELTDGLATCAMLFDSRGNTVWEYSSDVIPYDVTTQTQTIEQCTVDDQSTYLYINTIYRSGIERTIVDEVITLDAEGLETDRYTLEFHPQYPMEVFSMEKWNDRLLLIGGGWTEAQRSMIAQIVQANTDNSCEVYRSGTYGRILCAGFAEDLCYLLVLDEDDKVTMTLLVYDAQGALLREQTLSYSEKLYAKRIFAFGNEVWIAGEMNQDMFIGKK